MIIVDLWCGYNLGTPDLKLHKQVTKPYQNDTVYRENAMKNRTCNEQEKEFELQFFL